MTLRRNCLDTFFGSRTYLPSPTHRQQCQNVLRTPSENRHVWDERSETHRTSRSTGRFAPVASSSRRSSTKTTVRRIVDVGYPFSISRNPGAEFFPFPHKRHPAGTARTKPEVLLTWCGVENSPESPSSPPPGPQSGLEARLRPCASNRKSPDTHCAGQTRTVVSLDTRFSQRRKMTSTGTYFHFR